MNNRRFDLSFQKLPALLYQTVQPTPLKDPQPIILSEKCLKLLDLDHPQEKIWSWLNGEVRIPGDQRISTRYAGHQFGVWAGQLGDGRAISLGEILNTQGERWEVQTKGSGLTPFSRMGDGKAVIRSSVREYLCSEAMHALGIPTTRALALITGQDSVYRESIERSALVARVFPSNLRFGHFEYCFHFGFKTELKALAEYALEYFFPEQKDFRGMLEQIILRTAELIAQWQAHGFCHGVMNTDNMSLLGLTIDYGPFGFMEETQWDHISNHSDCQGRYAYMRQPQIALWNLDRLAVCFTPFLPQSELQNLLELYIPHYEKTWLQLFRKKLGLQHPCSEDTQLVSRLHQVLHQTKTDFTFFFRSLCEYERTHLQDPFKSDAWESWFREYDARLAQESSSVEERSAVLLQTNPKYVLRNYIAEEVIRSVEAGQTDRIHAWMKVLYSPFTEHPEFHKYSLPTPPEFRGIEVSCSS